VRTSRGPIHLAANLSGRAQVIAVPEGSELLAASAPVDLARLEALPLPVDSVVIWHEPCA
jgi:hypothetical protein